MVVEGAARSPEDEEGEGLFDGGQPPKEVPPVIGANVYLDLGELTVLYGNMAEHSKNKWETQVYKIY